MKKLITIISVTAALAFAAGTLSACGGAAESAVSAAGSAAQSAVSAVGSAAESAVSAAASAAESAVSAAESALDNIDFSNPVVVIESGDYAGMEAFAKELQSGGNVGKVVKITGISTRSPFGAKATISESDGSGKKIGTTYVIQGADSIDAYPEEDAEIVITGVVVKSDNGISCQIEVPAQNVTVNTKS